MTGTAPDAPDFRMLGARAALASGLTHIEEQIIGIELAVVGNPGLAFDLAKTLIESTCKTILTERTITFEPDDDLPKLFRAVTTHLPLLPVAAGHEASARKSLAKTLGGLHSVMQGVAELRNSYGFASHGSDSQRPVIEGLQAVLAAEAADTIVGFLYRVHRRGLVAQEEGPLRFEDNEGFNAYLDESNEPVRIFDLEYRPSEVLFSVDREAYRDIRTRYVPEDTGLDGAVLETGRDGLPDESA